MTEIVEQNWTDTDPETGKVSHNSYAGTSKSHDYASHPAWEFVDRQGRHHLARPLDGRPYSIKVNDLAEYEKAVQNGSFFFDLGRGHDMTDQRKTTG